MNSLRLRLLALTSALLGISFVLLGAAVDRSFLAALEAAQRDLLDSQVITLLAVAQADDNDALALPIDMPEPRLNAPGSGLYGKIRLESGDLLWRSASALAVDWQPLLPLPEVGERLFSRHQTAGGETLQALTIGVVWEFDSGDERYYAFSVAESRASLELQMSSFRNQLLLTFIAIALALLIITAALLSWLLRPLGQIAEEIESVEAGRLNRLSSEYPSELTGVARNLNTLLDSEQQRVSRYQQTLANLAHSLKTPLAAARNLLSGRDEPALQRELARMQDIVRYQLSRPAAASGRMLGRGAVAVLPELLAMLDGLDKVYRDKQVSAEVDVADGLQFFGDRGDLAEMLGNLLDNAYKWCERRVAVSASAIGDATQAKPGLALQVDDDGPGFPLNAAERALKRGQRLDEATPGTGIGLSVVAELVELYGGRIEIGTSQTLGGASLRIELPPV